MYQGERPFPFDRNSEPVKYWKRRQSIEALLEKLVSEVWKLNLSNYQVEELFPPLNLRAGQAPALQTIQHMLNSLLVNRQATALDGFGAAANIATIREDFRELAGGRRMGRRTGGKAADPGRGVRVHEVKLEGLYLSDDDTQRLVQQWVDDWRDGNLPPAEEPQDRTRREALIQFAEYAVMYFRERDGEQPRIQRVIDALVSLLKGTQKALPVNSEQHRRLAAAIRQLEDSPR
jgi:hypothetical protein